MCIRDSFSSSKLEQISREFKQANNLDAEIESNEIYLILTNAKEINEEGIKDVLSATEQDETFTFYVGPRLGTISPWSSKTEDIISNVGLKNILRVEKLFGFKINCNIDEGNIDLSMCLKNM